MGFGTKRRRWIQECISSSYFSILSNRSPKGFFLANWGLRQWESLSPFLLVIVGEVFIMMAMAAGNAGLIRGFKVAADAPIISHLQFADDTLIFCEANEGFIKNVTAI